MPQSNDPSFWRSALPALKQDGHKYDRGALVVFGGASMTGAARLAAAAGMRIGAGLCFVSAPAEVWPIYAASLPAHIITEKYEGVHSALADLRRKAAVIGPGLGGHRAQDVLDVVHTGRPAVLDADALTCFEGEPQRLLDALHGGCVLTPHEGEFARLFPDMKGDRAARAAAAAKKAGCVVVLKGAQTVVAAPDGEPVVNMLDAPMLATAGSGDVLAGMIGGLLAQGMAPFAAACAAVYVHALAARRFGAGLVAGDLPDIVPAVLRELP